MQCLYIAGKSSILSELIDKVSYFFILRTRTMTEKMLPKSLDWYSLSYSLGFMFKNKQLLLLSLLLILVMAGLTTLSYTLTVRYAEHHLQNLLTVPAQLPGIIGWVKHTGWLAAAWLFDVMMKIIVFYLSFLIAYTLSSPGYGLLSAAAEKLHIGERFTAENFSLTGLLVDMLEGLKIALFGLLVSMIALVINFIPAIGQAGLFLLYVYYSALMFIDFPASRRRWSLGRKLGWLKTHSQPAFRIGVFPALISLIPVVNIFCMSLLFPVLTIQSALNFSTIELVRDEGAV